MITEHLSTLKIHKLSKEQYERELAAGNIDESALYLTPDDRDYIVSGGSGGNGECIVDVVELPTSNINTDATYRVLNGTFIMNKLFRNDCDCYIVDWSGDPAGSGKGVIGEGVNGNLAYTGYYNINNNVVYGYFDQSSIDTIKQWIDKSDLNAIVKAALKATVNSMSTGWKTMDEIVSSVGSAMSLNWGGVVTSSDKVIDENALYLYVSGDLYFNRHGSWISADGGIGMRGAGIGAEIFNSFDNIATGLAAHAEGRNTQATSDVSHAEGYATVASGASSHVEGELSTASGHASHAEGYDTTAQGQNSHAEGCLTISEGAHAHVEGYGSKANGSASHAEGIWTIADGDAQHVQGRYNKVDSTAAFIIGNGLNTEDRSNALTIDWYGNAEFAGIVKSDGVSLATVEYVDGNKGYYTTAGLKNGTTLGSFATAEGSGNIAIGQYSHAEGFTTTAYAQSAHSEGEQSKATGPFSHAEGYGTEASEMGAHAEGVSSIASGVSSHAEGISTTASGMYAHSEGENTVASGQDSHAEGKGTIAASTFQHVQGAYNIEDAEIKYLHIVGNGDESIRSNAHTIDWDGNGWFKGTIKMGGVSQDDANAKTVATLDDLTTKQDKITGTAGQFVVIGDDGNLAAITLTNVSEVGA